MSREFWFTSSEIQIEPGEDKDTNLGRYGKNLAKWISEDFASRGYTTEFFPEDWGWRVNCHMNQCTVWIGVGNVDQMEYGGNTPASEDVIWYCFVESDVSFITRVFKKSDASLDRETVGRDLASLLDATSHVTFVEEP